MKAEIVKLICNMNYEIERLRNENEELVEVSINYIKDNFNQEVCVSKCGTKVSIELLTPKVIESFTKELELETFYESLDRYCNSKDDADLIADYLEI